MKNITIITMTIIVIVITNAASCKKYDEGGTYWRTEKKLTDKNWVFDYVDSEDNEYSIPEVLKNLKFSVNGDFILNNSTVGKYEFTDKYAKTISIPIDSEYIGVIDSICSPSVVENGYQLYSFRIAKLKNDELGLKNFINYETTIYYNAK